MRGRSADASAAAAAVPTVDAPMPAGGSKRDRQRAIRELVRPSAIGSQQELADRLIARAASR